MNEDEYAEALAKHVGKLLREEPVNDAGLSSLLARVRAMPTAEFSRQPRWLAAPVLIAASLALVVGVVIGRVWHKEASGAGGALAIRPGSDSDPRAVEFVFVAPAAHDVSVVGDFNDWNPTRTPMQRSVDGKEWTISLTLSAGRHLYSFVVNDSTWVSDPNAPIAPELFYGARSSILVVADRREP